MSTSRLYYDPDYVARGEEDTVRGLPPRELSR